MLIAFTQDYRGKLTGEQFFRAGELVDIPDAAAAQLVADGRATPYDPIPLTPEDLALAPEDADTLTPRDLAPSEEGVLTGTGEGEALPAITDPAEQRTAPARRGKKGA